MNRNVPKINNSLLFFLRSSKNRNEATEENYVELYQEFMINQEKSIEKSLIDLFRQLGINASVKSDRYSLPFNHQIKYTGYGESYLNGAYETEYFFRKILMELLNKDLHKVRFYVLAEVEDSFPMGKVNYYFNYYNKEK